MRAQLQRDSPAVRLITLTLILTLILTHPPRANSQQPNACAGATWL